MGMQASPLHVMLCDGGSNRGIYPVKRRSLEVVSLYEMLSSSVAWGYGMVGCVLDAYFLANIKAAVFLARIW